MGSRALVDVGSWRTGAQENAVLRSARAGSAQVEKKTGREAFHVLYNFDLDHGNHPVLGWFLGAN